MIVAGQFTTNEATMTAAVTSYRNTAGDVQGTLKQLEAAIQELWASNYLGKQRQALEGVFNDLAAQTQKVEQALGEQGLSGLVNNTWGTYSSTDDEVASSMNQVGGGAVFTRLAG